MNRDNLVCRVGSCRIIYVNMTRALPATIAMDGLGGREDAIEGEERSRFPRGIGDRVIGCRGVTLYTANAMASERGRY